MSLNVFGTIGTFFENSKIVAIVFTLPEPRRFFGLRLKSARSKAFEFFDKNCGIGSLACQKGIILKL